MFCSRDAAQHRQHITDGDIVLLIALGIAVYSIERRVVGFFVSWAVEKGFRLSSLLLRKSIDAPQFSAYDLARREEDAAGGDAHEAAHALLDRTGQLYGSRSARDVGVTVKAFSINLATLADSFSSLPFTVLHDLSFASAQSQPLPVWHAKRRHSDRHTITSTVARRPTDFRIDAHAVHGQPGADDGQRIVPPFDGSATRLGR